MNGHALQMPTYQTISAAERALVRWLTEFGYMHAAGGDVRVAFRMARTERGGERCRRELACRT